MGNKIEETMREFSECYDRLIKNVKVEDDSYYSTHIRLRSTVLKEFDAEKYNCTLQLKDEQRLDKGYYQQTWKIIGAYSMETFTLYVNLKSHYVCLNTNKIEPAEEPKEEQSKVPEFAQLCITNYERLQKLSILEIAEEFISIIHIKDEDGFTRKKYVVLNGDVCNSLSDAIKKNLEWLNDEAI